MTYEFKPWDKPTGGKPVPINIHEFDDPEHGHCVLNKSAVAVPILRDGRRVLLMRMSGCVLAPGDKVLMPTSKTEPPPPEELKRIEWRALRDHQMRRIECAPSFDENEEDEPSFAQSSAYVAADWFYRRTLPGGELLELKPLSYGNLILHLGKATPTGAPWVYDASWVFRDHDAAWRTVLGWNGEGDPEGWYRCYQTGRRRPDGTIESEHFQP